MTRTVKSACLLQDTVPEGPSGQTSEENASKNSLKKCSICVYTSVCILIRHRFNEQVDMVNHPCTCIKLFNVFEKSIMTAFI